MTKRRLLIFSAVFAIAAGWLTAPKPVSADSWNSPSSNGCVTSFELPSISLAGVSLLSVAYHITLPPSTPRTVAQGRWIGSNGGVGPSYAFVSNYAGGSVADFWTGNVSPTYFYVNIAYGSNGTATYKIARPADYGGCFTVDHVVVTRQFWGAGGGSGGGGGGGSGGGGGIASPTPSPTGEPSPSPYASYPAECNPSIEGCAPPAGYCWGYGPPAPGEGWPIYPCESEPPDPTPTPTPTPPPGAVCSGTDLFAGVTGSLGGTGGASNPHPYPANALDESSTSFASVGGGATSGWGVTTAAVAPVAYGVIYRYGAGGGGAAAPWHIEGTNDAGMVGWTMVINVTNVSGSATGYTASGSFQSYPAADGYNEMTYTLTGTPTAYKWFRIKSTTGGNNDFAMIRGCGAVASPSPTPTPDPSATSSAPPAQPTASQDGNPDGNPNDISVSICEDDPTILACMHSFEIGEVYGNPDPDEAGDAFSDLVEEARGKVPFGYVDQVSEAITDATTGAAGASSDYCFDLPRWQPAEAGGTVTEELCIPLQDFADSAASWRPLWVALLTILVGVAVVRWAVRTAPGG